MPWFLVLIAFTIAAFLFRRLRRLRRLARELEAAARANRRLLPRESRKSLKSLGIDGLVREFNDAIDRRHRFEARNAGYSTQVEAMLRAVQEVVIVFNAERKVEFANRAAELLFRRGRSLTGLRLEGIMRSLSLLELLDAAARPGGSEPRQIHLEQDDKSLWFEASCAPVRGALLVLHNITRLKELEMMRRDFVANVSHELRTPLTIIKAFAFDRFRINQVLDNLVENVFRYAPEFTRLRLKVELDRAAGLVVGSVIDDGPGIPEKDLPHIFGRFYRVDQGRSRERGGTGLGLTIVKHIVQLHGGTLRADNNPEGGARIVFTLPYARTAAVPAET